MQPKNYSSYSDNSLTFNHLKYIDLVWDTTIPETHDVFEIIFLKKGSVTYVSEGKSYSVKENSIIFTRPGKMHTIYFDNKSIYDRFDILFSDELIACGLCTKMPEHTEVIDIDGHPHINQLFEKMDFYSESFKAYEFKNLLINLIEEICYNLILLSEKNNSSYSVNPLITKAVEYIEQNIGAGFTLEQLCKELYITKSHLHRLFLSHMNLPPKRFITAKRLELAQKLIRSGEKPINVFSRCGFSEYSTFWRDYKKHFGYSPSDELKRETIRKIEF